MKSFMDAEESDEEAGSDPAAMDVAPQTDEEIAKEKAEKVSRSEERKRRAGNTTTTIMVVRSSALVVALV